MRADRGAVDRDERSEAAAGIEACGQRDAVDGRPVGIAVAETTVEMARLVLSVCLGTVINASVAGLLR